MLSGDVPRLPSYGIYISQLVRFARCCTSVLDFNSKNLQITSKLLTQDYRYHKLRKTFGKFFRSYSELLSKFGDISFQEYLSKGISHPVFYGDLVYKLRRVKDTPNFISSGSKIVKRLRRQQYDPVIIERTIGLVLGPSTALYEHFLKHCTLTNKAVGTIWRALSKPPQRRHGPDLFPLWLLVGTPSAIRPELAFSRAEHSRPYSDVLQKVLWSIWGSHQTLWSLPFPNVTWHCGTWPYTMTHSIDQTLHQFANLLPNWTLLPILTLLPNFGGFHRTLQRMRIANRGRLLLGTPGPGPYGTCICSNVEINLSWTCHVYGPFESRTSLGTSIFLWYVIFINYLFVYWFLWSLRLVWLLVCCLYKEVYLQIFKCVSFWLHGCCG